MAQHARSDSGDTNDRLAMSIISENAICPVSNDSDPHITTAIANSSGRARGCQIKTGKLNSNSTMAWVQASISLGYSRRAVRSISRDSLRAISHHAAVPRHQTLPPNLEVPIMRKSIARWTWIKRVAIVAAIDGLAASRAAIAAGPIAAAFRRASRGSIDR